MSELSHFRHSKDHFLKHDPNSPLTEDQKRDFRGLSYYSDNPDLRLELELEPFGNKEVVELLTSTGEPASLLRWGKISFEIDGEPSQLTIFRDTDADDFFLPFTDANSGDETYGASRYLDIETLPDGRARVDFNYAYNPYCAYNDGWVCPLTPQENRLSVPIRAGEKKFK